MRTLLLFSLLLLSSIKAFTQSPQHGQQGKKPEPKGSVMGKVFDQDANGPLEYATISAYQIPGDKLITGTISRADGTFMMELPVASYYLLVEFISYEPTKSKEFKIERPGHVVDVQTISVKPSSVGLDEVEIVREKSQMVASIDKKVYNPQADLSGVSGNAQDLLENIPSVQVDQEGNLSLRGSQNVRVLIDGRPSGFGGISGSQILEMIPSSQIESIEIITNPSAKYDAEGMAGIINIVTKKDKKKGFNGMLTGGFGVPDHKDHFMPNYNSALNFNLNKGKLNLFGNIGFNKRGAPGEVGYDRLFYGNPDSLIHNEQEGVFLRERVSTAFKLGTDINLSSNQKLTASVGGQFGDRYQDRTTNYYDYDFNDVLTDTYQRIITEDHQMMNFESNLGYNFESTKKEGRKALVDVTFNQRSGQKKATGEETQYNPNLKDETDTEDGELNFIVQIDFTEPLGENGKLEYGVKGTQRNIENKFETYNTTNERILLDEYSNDFIFDEYVHAAYVTYQNKLNKINYQLGLRGERTILKSGLASTSGFSHRDYLNLFPTLHLSRKIKEGSEVTLGYSKRIQRPHFWNLNPFFHLADKQNFWVGNPDLQPEFTHAVEAGWIRYWKKANLNATIFYRHADDVIQRIRTVEYLDTAQILITKPYNLSWRKSWGVEVNGFINPVKWWKVMGSVSVFMNHIDGGNFGETYEAKNTASMFRINNTFTITKGLSTQLNWFMRPGTNTVQGNRSAFSRTEIGVKQNLWGRKAYVQLRVRDVFNHMIFKSYSNDPTQQAEISTYYRRSPRYYGLDFSYSINNYRPKRRGGNRGGGMDMEM